LAGPGQAQPRRRLLVVRDRAHAPAAEAAEAAETAGPTGAGARERAVWTHAELFERLAAWALLGTDGTGPPGVRDDEAPLWAIAAALSRVDPLLARIAYDADELRCALVHGGATAAEVARALPAAAAGRLIAGEELRSLFARLAEAEERLLPRRLVDRAGALARAAERLARGEVPRSLAAFSVIELHDLVEPTDLELRCLTALARAGAALTVRLPVDSLGRGLLAGVEPVLRAFEAAHDAPWLELDLEDVARAEDADERDGVLGFARAFYGKDTAPAAPVEVAQLPDEAAEGRHVAAVVAAWRRAHPRARIAVALRTVDAAAARIADALGSHGIPVRLRRRPLLETPAARLLLDVLALARDGAPRDRLLAVLTSAARKGALSSADGARVLRALRVSAARSDVEDEGRPTGGYRHRLERALSGLGASGSPRSTGFDGDDVLRADIELALVHVERVLSFAARVPRRAPLLAHLESAAALAAELFDDAAGLGCAEVRDVLDTCRSACAAVSPPGQASPALSSAALSSAALEPRAGQPAVALAAFATLLTRALERAQGPASEVEDDHAVEVLALPEMWGRRFDHVVVAGMVEGRLPRTERGERLLGDADRALVNRALGRRVLRLLDDDPLERSPVPRAQALEPMWMLGALLAASGSLLLTAPRRDGRGREIAPSVFLLEALRALGADPSASRAGARFALEAAPRDVVVRAARLRALGALDDARASALSIPPELLARADLFHRMSSERAAFFAKKARMLRADRSALDFSALRAPFAFAVDPDRIARAFGTSFGLSAERPLTPTRLEALAECRVHGFAQHVLKVDVDPPAGNAADARVLGTLAHSVMERFFRERRESGVPAASVSAADRRRVRALLAEEAAPLLRGRATGHLGAIRAQIGWLETALVRAVSMLARDPKVAGVEPSSFEVQIGAPQGEAPPELASVPLSLGPAKGTIWIGGIIDRIDEGPRARAVIDYKTASTGSVRRKAHKEALFETHFQLLLYLRLLEHHRPSPETTALHGYLVSLRDGTTSGDVHEIEDLRARVLDDGRADGLAAGVARVVLPILEGTLPPDAGDRCESCRLQRLCRVPLAAEFAPDLDDPEESASS
jgi:ATP-dependent helicase/nuclease subunit B